MNASSSPSNTSSQLANSSLLANSSQSQNSSDASLCPIAQTFVLNVPGTVPRWIQICLCLITLVLIIRLALIKRKCSSTFHANFTILFMNMVFIAGFYCFGALCLQLPYLFLFFFHSNPCDFLVPLWLAFVARIPAYVHLVGLPMFHLAITSERIRATLFAWTYERTGVRFDMAKLVIMWLLILAFNVFIVVTVVLHPDWSLIRPYASLVMPGNASVVLYMHYVALVLVILTVASDYWVVRYNWLQQQNKIAHPSCYSLSHKYQLNENLLSMRLMLPLDCSFAVLFLLYLISSTWTRSMKEQQALSMVTFESVYDWVYCVNMLHGIITVWLYSRFITETRARRAKTVEVRPMQSQADLHFRELQSQWLTVAKKTSNTVWPAQKGTITG